MPSAFLDRHHPPLDSKEKRLRKQYETVVVRDEKRRVWADIFLDKVKTALSASDSVVPAEEFHAALMETDHPRLQAVRDYLDAHSDRPPERVVDGLLLAKLRTAITFAPGGDRGALTQIENAACTVTHDDFEPVRKQASTQQLADLVAMICDEAHEEAKKFVQKYDAERRTTRQP